jgi:hypothetical protein
MVGGPMQSAEGKTKNKAVPNNITTFMLPIKVVFPK